MRTLGAPRLPSAIQSGPNERFLVQLVTQLTIYLTDAATRIDGTLPKDGTEVMSGPMTLATYTVVTRPTASDYEGAVIYVSDGGAGAVFQGSDGTSWVNLG